MIQPLCNNFFPVGGLHGTPSSLLPALRPGGSNSDERWGALDLQAGKWLIGAPPHQIQRRHSSPSPMISDGLPLVQPLGEL